MLPLGACGSSDSDSDSSTSTAADDDLQTEPSETDDVSETDSEPTNTDDADGNSTPSDDGEPPVGELPEDDTDEINFGGGADISVSVGEDPDEGESDDASDDEPVKPLVSCSAAVGTGDAPTIDDFEDADQSLLTQDGRDAGWYWYNSAADEEQGFIIEVSDDFPSGTHAMHTWGSAYDWAGIGAGLRWSAPDEDDIWQDCLYDASVYEGVRFWARGNGESVRFSISVPGVIPVEEGGTCDGGCWNNHGVDLVIGEEWQEYFLGFDEMLQNSGDLGPLDPRELRTFQFEFPYGGDFDLWLDEIGFFSAGDAPSAVPDETSDDAGDDTSTDDDNPTDDAADDDAADDSLMDDTTSGDDTSSSDPDAGAPNEPAADGGS